MQFQKNVFVPCFCAKCHLYVNGPLQKTFQLKETFELSLHTLEKGAYVIHYQNESMKGMWRFVKN